MKKFFIVGILVLVITFNIAMLTPGASEPVEYNIGEYLNIHCAAIDCRRQSEQIVTFRNGLGGAYMCGFCDVHTSGIRDSGMAYKSIGDFDIDFRYCR